MRRALLRVQLRLLVEEPREVDLLLRQLDPGLLHALHVEEVLEQRGEAARLRIDDAEIVPPRRGIELALQEEGGEAEHARERGAQLVRDDVDELGLHALALAELRVLLLELGPASC
jgi:hypothetical protein